MQNIITKQVQLVQFFNERCDWNIILMSNFLSKVKYYLDFKRIKSGIGVVYWVNKFPRGIRERVPGPSLLEIFVRRG